MSVVGGRPPAGLGRAGLLAGSLSGESDSSRSVRGCCTSERSVPTNRFRVFRAIPGFSWNVGFQRMGSHVQRGPLCTWEDFNNVEH